MIAASTLLTVPAEYCHPPGRVTRPSRARSSCATATPTTPPTRGSAQRLFLSPCLSWKAVAHEITGGSRPVRRHRFLGAPARGGYLRRAALVDGGRVVGGPGPRSPRRPAWDGACPASAATAGDRLRSARVAFCRRPSPPPNTGPPTVSCARRPASTREVRSARTRLLPRRGRTRRPWTACSRRGRGGAHSESLGDVPIEGGEIRKVPGGRCHVRPPRWCVVAALLTLDHPRDDRSCILDTRRGRGAVGEWPRPGGGQPHGLDYSRGACRVGAGVTHRTTLRRPARPPSAGGGGPAPSRRAYSGGLPRRHPARPVVAPAAPTRRTRPSRRRSRVA
jgi:hypothetical protein